MSDMTDWSPENLPAWARGAFEAALKPSAAPSVLDYRGAAAWPLLVEAAVVNSFLPRELAPGLVAEEKRPDAERIVLNFAETKRETDGVKWSLTQDTRIEVLQAAISTPDLQEAIERTSRHFSDRVSQALRDCLSTSASVFEDSDLPSLEAQRIAVGSLSGVSGITLPELDDLDREIEFRRLLRAFEHMVGRRSPPGATEKEERFFGRADEMERLRDYVGIIPSDTIARGAQRFLNWLSRTILGRAPMAVWGVGGAGKTTLISKFMLEHAEAAVSRYPFAYLDFDRNTISARRRSGLLAEMCLQVGAQFKELTKPMAELRARVSHFGRSRETSREFENTSELKPFTQEFRRLVDGCLEHQEKTLEWARPFLLVFDTFEVVQYAEDDVVGLQEFVSGFSYPDEKGLWNRLRLIISGRKQVENFIVPIEGLLVGALDAAGSAAMLMALAADARKPLSEGDATSLAAALARATQEPNGGVQPLRLRLIGELFEKEVVDGPTLAGSLEQELSQPLESDGLAAQILIDGVLIRRVLGHVSDGRVRALADPGLVVRRITPEVILEVMTRGTNNPSVGEADDVDGDPVEPWIIKKEEAEKIFEAFAKEVTLVEPVDQGATALRHRADVRQQMLPLIKLRRPIRFKLLNKLAFDHFSKLAAKDPDDKASAAEAIYHGLWLGIPLSRLNPLWSNDEGFDPRIDTAEFEWRPDTVIYLRAKTGGKLNANEVARLPHDVALGWLKSRARDLLDERRIEDAIKAIRTAAGDNYEALGDHLGIAAVLARLLYRSGQWSEARELASRYLDHAGPDDLRGPDVRQERSRAEKTESRSSSVLSLLRTAVTIEAKSLVSSSFIKLALADAPEIRDPLARIEVLALTLIGATGTHQVQRRHGEKLETLIQHSVPEVSRSLWKQQQNVLRLAILTTHGVNPELTELWFEWRERVPRDVDVSMLMKMLLLIFRDHPAAKEITSLHKELYSAKTVDAWNRVDQLWRREKSIVLRALRTNYDLRNAFWALLSYEVSDWIRPLGNALTRALRTEGAGDQLIKFLDKSDFWKRKARSAQGRQHDGIGIVQLAADEGKLLQLVELLDNWNGKTLFKRSSAPSKTPYPENIFDICAALSRWQITILESFRPLPPTQVTPPGSSTMTPNMSSPSMPSLGAS